MLEGIDWEGLKFWGATALFNPLFLAFLLAVFFLGKFAGVLTKRVSWWKLLILAYLAVFLFEPLRDAGPIIGALFVLGFLTKHTGTIWGIVSWAGGLGDIVFALRYRRAYDDIRGREQELEAREQRLRDAERRQAAQAQQQKSQSRTGWQQEAKSFRKKPEDRREQQSSQDRAGSSRKGSSASASNTRGQQERTQQKRTQGPTSTPQSSVRNQYLLILGLKLGNSYTAEEIKRAYRRKVMKAHPDAGGSQAELIAVVSAYEWLRVQTKNV